MAYPFAGKAIFSTRNGEYARRERIPSMRIILRSDPVEDQLTMVANLQEGFPEVCRTITSPVTDSSIYEYFDYCDAAVHGFEFLRAVLEYIAWLNAGATAERVMKVQTYVGRWMHTNAEAFTYIRPYHAVLDLFTEEDLEEYGDEFLIEAMMQIKRLRLQEDDHDPRCSLYLQMQHAHMWHNQRNLTQSQAPAQPPFSANPSLAQGMRASSNPEYGRPQSQRGPLRHLPGPPGQFSAPQSRFPLPRLTSSTEILEHIHPGSTRRGDFHSDPTAHSTTESEKLGPPNNCIAIPSGGLPGPFTYRPLPPSSRHGPLLDRTRPFDGNLPKGKRNPKKKSSDDARMVLRAGISPRQMSNSANSTQSFNPHNILVPIHPRFTDTLPFVQDVRPSATYTGNYRHPNLPQSHHPVGEQETFHHPSHHGQDPIQPPREGHSRQRTVTNPFLPSPSRLQCSTPKPHAAEPGLPTSTNMQHQIATANEQLFEENALLSPQFPPDNSQALDPYAFGYQLPDRQIDTQCQQDHTLQSRKPTLARISNAAQPQPSGTPEHSRADEIVRRPVQEACTIWIGGLPSDFDKAAVMNLLRPCRGLLDITVPKVSQSSKGRMFRSFAFAEFQDPSDAAEAMERIPQTQYSTLPEGVYLSTNYPKTKIHASPRYHRHGSDGASNWPVSTVSPIKPRKGEDSDGIGKFKIEHGRKPSKGHARGKKPSISILEAQAAGYSEPVSAVNADQNELDLQLEDEVVVSSPDGKAGSTPRVSQLSTDGLDSAYMGPRSGVIQPDPCVDTHATQVSRVKGDGAQDTSSIPRAILIQESHQATSSKNSHGRTKTSKKKSKGSNKLSDKKVPETPTEHPAFGNAKQEAQRKSYVNEDSEAQGNSVSIEEKENLAGSKTKASSTVASTVTSEPDFTLPKDIESANQSFLGRNPTEDDGEQPKASVVFIGQASGIEENKTKSSEMKPAPVEFALSAGPLEQSNEPTSQVMTQDGSVSSQCSTTTDPSILSYTPLLCSSQSERSNNSSQEVSSPIVQAARLSLDTKLLCLFVEPGETRNKSEASVISSSAPRSGSAAFIERAFDEDAQSQDARKDEEFALQNIEPGETSTKELLEPLTSLEAFEVVEGTDQAQKELSEPYSIFGGLQSGLIEKDAEQAPGTSLKQPSPTDPNQAFLRSPTRKRALSIPPRSSSLVSPLTPIKTHQKKKPRKLTPVKEASLSKVTGSLIEGTKLDASLQTTGSTKRNLPILTIEPAARTSKEDALKDLPKPETPFLMDDGVRVTPPKINRQVVEPSNADGYYAQKNDYQVFHWSNATNISPICGLDSSDSALSQPSEATTPDHASPKKQDDLETILREAGFRSLSGTSPFAIKDPILAWFETIDEEGRPLENRTNKDEHVLTWVSDKGKLGQLINLDAWAKQNEMIELVKKATAAKRLLASSPPPLWTRIQSLRLQLSRFITHDDSDPHEQWTSKPKAQQCQKAKALLETIPRRESSMSEMQTWSKRVSHFIQENSTEPLPSDAEHRKSTTNSPTKSSQDASPRRQQQKHRCSVPIDAPDPQNLARNSGNEKDAFSTTDTDFDQSFTNGQTTVSEPSSSTCGRRTPSEEDSNSSAVLESCVAFYQASKPKDPFIETGEDRRRCFDGRHQFTNIQEEEHIISSDPELTLSGEFDMSKMTEIKDLQPEREDKKMENKAQQSPHMDHESDGKQIDCKEGKQDQNPPVESNNPKDPTFVESDDRALQKQTLQSFLDSSHRTNNEDISDEVQTSRVIGGQDPLKRSGYNAVAGRGLDGNRGGRMGASKDPWALPQGEKPWGSGWEGRGGKKCEG